MSDKLRLLFDRMIDLSRNERGAMLNNECLSACELLELNALLQADTARSTVLDCPLELFLICLGGRERRQ